jgi:hypothetical protein
VVVVKTSGAAPPEQEASTTVRKSIRVPKVIMRFNRFIVIHS